MVARAESAAITRSRILRAAMELFMDRFLDQISLEEIADRAHVSVPTVLRHFSTRDGVVEAAGEELLRQVFTRRDEVATAGLTSVVRALMDDYESTGDLTTRALAQEDRSPVLRPLLEKGRALHRTWTQRAFASELGRLRTRKRSHLLNGLVAAGDVYVWKLLRRDMKLGRKAASDLMQSLIEGLLRGES